MVAAIVYFLAAEWSPCHRARRALLAILLFNLWALLPLSSSSQVEKIGKSSKRSSSSRASIPFWAPPPWLRQSFVAARLLVRASCIGLPGCIIGASVLPEGFDSISILYSSFPLRPPPPRTARTRCTSCIGLRCFISTWYASTQALLFLVFLTITQEYAILCPSPCAWSWVSSCSSSNSPFFCASAFLWPCLQSYFL